MAFKSLHALAQSSSLAKHTHTHTHTHTLSRQIGTLIIFTPHVSIVLALIFSFLFTGIVFLLIGLIKILHFRISHYTAFCNGLSLHTWTNFLFFKKKTVHILLYIFLKILVSFCLIIIYEQGNRDSRWGVKQLVQSHLGQKLVDPSKTCIHHVIIHLLS